MLLKKEATKTGLIYALLIAFIYMSGSAFMTMHYYKISLFCLLFLTLIIAFLVKLRKTDSLIPKTFVLGILGMCMAISIINAGIISDTYAAVFLQLAFALLFTELCSFTNFKKYYFDVISCLAIISLVFYAVLSIYPQVMLLFPKFHGLGNIDYYNAGIYVFGAFNTYETFVPFLRNNGIFWEPGCYQAFLNIGIIFALDKYQKANAFSKWDWVKSIALVLTVLTTYSTMGYAVLFLVFAANYRLFLPVIKKYKKWLAIGAGVLVLVLLLYFLFSSPASKIGGIKFFFKKIIKEITNGVFITRINLPEFRILFENPKAFWGMSAVAFDNLYANVANSVLHTAVTIGVPFVTILLTLYFGFAKRIRTANKWVLFACLVLCFFNEMILWRPFFVCLAWYGFEELLNRGKHPDENQEQPVKEYRYIARMFDAATYQKVFVNDQKPMQAANKYHTLLCNGLAANGINVHCFSVLPVNKENCSKHFVKMKRIKTKGITLCFPLICNLPVIKQLYLMVSAFFSTLFAPEHSVLLYDVLVVAPSYGACVAAKLRKMKKIAIVTDLPEFMEISESGWMLRLNDKLVSLADGYVLLTKQMNDKINKTDKPNIVLEGHVDCEMVHKNHLPFSQIGKKEVIYAGSLQIKYGIQMLCEAFLSCAKKDEVLHVYGDGEYAPALKELATQNSNIVYHGNVPNEEVVEAELNATLLVNPRPSTEEFTRYSFPSKTMEYMVSGTPVLMTRLPGMPCEYAKYVYLFGEENTQAFAQKLREILDKPLSELEVFGQKARAFVLEKKNNVYQTNKIVEFIDALR